MSYTFPSLVHFASIPKPQLIANSKSHFSAFQLRQCEPSNSLLVQSQVPSNGDICLGLTFFETFVVIRFYFDERSKNVLILVCIFVSGMFCQDYLS
jgi:hypothetical protein